MLLNDILDTLRSMKPRYIQEGLDILGVFGSRARNQASQNSDIDILIETSNTFLQNYPDGFSGFSRLAEVKAELEKVFETKVDLVDKVGLIQHGNTHIPKSTVYV
jgi:uncharacterized protein